MAQDKLQRLIDAGVAVDQLSDAEREVFAGLTSEEIATLASVQQRVAAITEVAGMEDKTVNIIC